MYHECRISDKHGNLIKVVTPKQQVKKSAKKYKAMLCAHQRKMIMFLEVDEMDEYNCIKPEAN